MSSESGSAKAMVSHVASLEMIGCTKTVPWVSASGELGVRQARLREAEGEGLGKFAFGC